MMGKKMFNEWTEWKESTFEWTCDRYDKNNLLNRIERKLQLGFSVFKSRDRTLHSLAPL